MDGLHGKAAQLDLLARRDLHELGLSGQAELFQLVLDQTTGQAGAVNGQVDLLQQIRNAANVVLVAVSDQQTTPYISLSGKTRPQSTMIISPLHSYTVMFLPTSPRPPSG